MVDKLRYLSVCSGIEAASVAWKHLDWEPVGFSEIDPFANSVLAYHYPTVPNYGDFTKIGNEIGTVDLIVGGTPCQDFSVAGLRAGLAGDRGHLTIEFIHLIKRILPTWFVWENVPGVLSSDGGRAFGTFLGALANIGYGFAYRVLDARYFGVPQRRRRVFVVGHLGNWRRAAKVLFEPESLSGNPAPSNGQGAIASALTAHGLGGGGPDDNLAQGNHIISTLQAHASKGWVDSPMIVFDTTQITSRTNRSNPRLGDPCHTLSRSGDPPTIAFSSKDSGNDAGENVSPTLRAMNAVNGTPNAGGQVDVTTQTVVRRLTPRECERLQGFPDDYTLVPYTHGKLATDGPRYRSLGNSFAVPVVRWIGERIEMQHA